MLTRLSFYIFCGILATVAIPYGAVHNWVWSFYICFVAVSYLAYLWSGNQRQSTGYRKVLLLTICFFFIWTSLQLLPLPESLLSVLSPVKYQKTLEGYKVLGAPSTFKALAYIPQSALAWWTLLAALALFFQVTCFHIQEYRKFRLLLLILLVVCSIESLMGLLQVLIPEMKVLWSKVTAYQGFARGTYINRNHFAGFIEMTLPLVTAIALKPQVLFREKDDWHDGQSQHNYQRLFLFSIMVLMILVLLFSASRAGITSGFLGMMCFFVLARIRSRRTPLAVKIMAVGSVVLINIYGATIGFKVIVDRFLRIDQISSRVEFWEAGIQILKDHPYGIGLANTIFVAPKYNTSIEGGQKILDYLHNDYLQLFVETGWIGACLLLFTFYFFLFISCRNLVKYRKVLPSQQYVFCSAAFSGIVAMAFHSFFDFNLQIPANCFYFVFLLAMVATYSTPRKSQKRFRQRD